MGDDAFNLDAWYNFVEAAPAFSARIRGRRHPDRVVVICEDGIEMFNKELYELALDIMRNEEDEDEQLAAIYRAEISRFS